MPYLEYTASESVKGRPRTLVFSITGLVLFLAWQAFSLRAFIRTETRPPAWKAIGYLSVARDYHKALRSDKPPTFLQLSPRVDQPLLPPLFYLGLVRAFDTDNPAGEALWANWFYLAVLCAAVFGLAYHFRPDQAAFIAPVLLACSPVVRAFYFEVSPYLGAMAMVALAYWVLILSDQFERWLGSVVFGAVFAAGMLHTPFFFVYMLPALAIGLMALSDPPRTPKAVAALAIALAGFLPWYAANLPKLIVGLVLFLS